MTFVPTPKGDLWPLEQTFDAGGEVLHQVLSRLHWAEQDAASLASSVADLYARLGGASGVWEWSGTPRDVDPGLGKVSVAITTANDRRLMVAKTDADGATFDFAALMPGSTIMLTDDPTTPPTTAFRQYVVTADPVLSSTWVQIAAVRIASYGDQDVPAVGSRIRLLLR